MISKTLHMMQNMYVLRKVKKLEIFDIPGSIICWSDESSLSGVKVTTGDLRFIGEKI